MRARGAEAGLEFARGGEEGFNDGLGQAGKGEEVAAREVTDGRVFPEQFLGRGGGNGDERLDGNGSGGHGVSSTRPRVRGLVATGETGKGDYRRAGREGKEGGEGDDERRHGAGPRVQGIGKRSVVAEEQSAGAALRSEGTAQFFQGASECGAFTVARSQGTAEQSKGTEAFFQGTGGLSALAEEQRHGPEEFVRRSARFIEVETRVGIGRVNNW